MNDRRDDDLLAALAAADPIDLDAVPAPDRALLEEIIAMEPTPSVTQPTSEHGSSERRSPNRRSSFAVAAAVALAAGVGAGALALNDDDGKAADRPTLTTPTREPTKVTGIEPAPRTGERAGETMNSCVIFDETILAMQEYAFDGTVTAIDDGWVTFAVTEWFKGPGGAVVVLNAEALSPRDPGFATSVDELLITEPGQRILVSGAAGYAGVCGATRVYDATTAEEWRAALTP